MLISQIFTRLGSSPSRFVFGSRGGTALCVARALVGVAVFVGVAGLPGCEKTPAASPSATPSQAGQSYTVRGVIEQVPDAAKPANTLRIHHEAIPGFMSAGKLVGMAEMSMPFPVAPGVSLDGLAIGDAVEFVFEVQEKPRLDYRVTRITKLPAGTPLNFSDSKATDPAPGSAPKGS
jgi:Cu/Ag efflux protein CusF